MPNLWETGEPVKKGLWESGIPVVAAGAQDNVTEITTTPEPEMWKSGKTTTTAQKPKWEAGIPVGEKKSGYQAFIEGTLGEGIVTGEFDHMTKLGKTLDLLGRPGYAIKAAINESNQGVHQYLLDNGLSEEEAVDQFSIKRQELLIKYKPRIVSRFRAAWRGLTGQERVTANQLWSNVGVEGIPLLGFATEIALDPLMYKILPMRVKAPVYFKGTKPAGIVTDVATKVWTSKTGYEVIGTGLGLGVKPVASFLGRQGQKIPQITKTTDFILDKTGDIGNALHNMFVTKSRIPELATKVGKYLDERKWLGGHGIKVGVEIRDAIVQEARRSGKSVEDVQRNIANYIEIPNATTATHGEISIASLLKERFEKTYTAMTEKGVPISSLGMARREKLNELHKALENAVGTEKEKLLIEIKSRRANTQKEIEEFKTQIKPLYIDVAFWSKDPKIIKFKINTKTVDNDLGIDFGSESAALAQKQDLGKGLEGKVYPARISPRRIIDLTDQPEQLQYWDNPDAVLESIYKAGVLTKPEYDDLRSLIPKLSDPKYTKEELPQIKPPTQKTTIPKVISKLVASPKDEEGVAFNLKIFKKKTKWTQDEIDEMSELQTTGEAVISSDRAGVQLKVVYNIKDGRYRIYTLENAPQKTQEKVVSGNISQGKPKFNEDSFLKDRNQWYTNFRDRLTKKGYDSIKYYALEDKSIPTYKILTSRIIDKARKAEERTQGKILGKITKGEAELADLVNKATDIQNMQVTKEEVAQTATKLGINLAEAREFAQIQKARELGYFPRFTTKEAEAFLRAASKSRGFGSKVWNPRIKNALERQTKDFTLDEWNTLVREEGLESLGWTKIKEYFMRDPAYVIAKYEIDAAKAITSAEFLQDTIKTFGRSGIKAPVGWLELPEDIIKLYPQAKGVVFDPDIVKEITRITEHYLNPEMSGPVLKIIDGIQNSWRKWTLVWFPKYHLRNMVGNMWNNYLAGVDPLAYNKAQAIQLWRKYGGKGNSGEKIAVFDLARVGLRPEMANEIIESAERHGVLGHGWYAADVEMGIQQQFAPKLIDRAQAIGTTVENNARLAHYVSKMEDGLTTAEAAESVKKFLFDYSDLTSFEREIMRRIFPFYTWTRKNVPLQLEQLYNNPQKFAPLTIPVRMRNEEDMIKLKYARPDMYQRLPIELQRTIDTVTYVPLEGLIPAGDLAKMVRPHELIFELLTPYIRTPIELYMNKSMYFESEIQKYPQETQELWRLDIPVRLKYIATSILPQARLLSEIDKIVRKQDTQKEELTSSELVFSQSLSSIYKVDLKELKNRALGHMKKDIEELKMGMQKAKKAGRIEEADRIKKTYLQVKVEINKIRGKF